MNDVINGVPRELLEEALLDLESGMMCNPSAETLSQLRALLTAQPQASAAQSAPAGERETIRAVFLRNGFTVKEGQTDLKPYVYAAAEELLSIARAAWQRTQSAGVPEGWQEELNLIRAVLEGYTPSIVRNDALRAVKKLAAAPAQPAAQDLCNCPAGSKPEPHKHAPNCPYRTGAAAQDQGEVQRLREALNRIRDHAARVMDDEVFYEADSALNGAAASTGQEV